MSDRIAVPPVLFAFYTTNPAALAAARAARTTRLNFRREVLRPALAALGSSPGSIGPHSAPARPGGPMQIIGLQASVTAVIPAGWDINVGPRRGSHYLRPAPGSAGTAARLWLARTQPEPDADTCYVLKTYGLAYRGLIGDPHGAYQLHPPGVFEHDGKLWASYRGAPVGDDPAEPFTMTWTQADLDDYRAFRNARNAALSARGAELAAMRIQARQAARDEDNR